MSGRGLWVVVGWCAGLASTALGCQPAEETRFDPAPPCLIEQPCPDDPSKTCQVPCKGGKPGTGDPGSSGGAGGTAGFGGAGGAGGDGGGGPVDVSGNIVQFVSTELEDTAPYLDAITIVAPGVAQDFVQADAEGGAFVLVGAEAGVQWVLAQDGNAGAGGAYSTYSLQAMEAGTTLAVPVVPVDVIDAIASQISPGGITAGRGHVVLQIADEDGVVLSDVELAPLAGSTVGYDVAPGQYSTSTAATGTLGLTVVLNVLVAGAGTVTVTMTYQGVPYQASIPIAPDAVTYGRVGIDLTP